MAFHFKDNYVPYLDGMQRDTCVSLNPLPSNKMICKRRGAVYSGKIFTGE